MTKNEEEFGHWFNVDGPALLRELGLKPGDGDVVDFGCGQGSYTLPLARVVPPSLVHAIDRSTENLAVLGERLAEYGLRHAVRIVSNEGKLRFARVPAASCQAVLLFDVLQHVDDWGVLLRECRRVLRPNGQLLLNPSTLSHPGKVDVENLTARLDALNIVPRVQLRRHIMHYKHFEEEELLAFVALTPFRRRVYRAVSRIPEGRVSTYGDIAQAIDCGSARAVGQALRNNPLAPSVPCHRVVAGDMSLHGFSGQNHGDEPAKKKALLQQEGVVFTTPTKVDPKCRM